MAIKIEFKKSGKTFAWDSRFANILDFAEAKGIQMDSGCRIGTCSTCKVKLLSGEVAMETEEGLNDEDRAQKMILPCVAVPEMDIVIDL